MKKSLLLITLMVLLTPWALKADELTVFEGTNTNNYVPFNGVYADYGTRGQFIIPADSLAAITGGTISQITFYSSQATLSYDQEVTVYMAEVSYDVFATADLENWSSMTTVYTGTFGVSNNVAVVELSNPFTYAGGNLMIGLQVTNWGSSCPTSTWYGVSQATGVYTAAYNNANYSHTWSTTVNRVAFIPKVTFEYTAGSGPVCDRPTSLVVSDTTATSVTLTWEEGSGEYNVEYKKASDENWTVLLSATNDVTTELTNLVPATSYQARVQSICGSDVSGWKGASFQTPCAAYDIPYSYGFEDAAAFACWTPVKGVTIESSHANTGSKNLKFAGENPFVLLPEFNDPLNTIRLEFWTRPESFSSNSGIFDVGYVTDPTDTTTFVALASYNRTEWTSTDYVKKVVDFNNAPVGATIAMRQRDNSSYYYWFVDDVTVKAIPSCLAPTGLQMTSATTSSATLTWTASSGESEWRLYYKKATAAGYIEVNNITTNSFTLPDLEAATLYKAYVVAKCSASDVSEASDSITFATECVAISEYPWVDSLDAYTGSTSANVNNLPICWNYINECTYSYYKGYPIIYNSASYAHSGTNSLRLYSVYSTYTDYNPQPQYAILPEMTDIDDKQLTAWIKGYNATSTVKVGRMDDPADSTTFHLIAEQTLTTSYAEYTFDLSQATGDYIVFMIDAATSGRTYVGAYIDDISVHEAPSCTKPSAPAAANVTAHTASISWTPGAEETAWQIMVNNDAEHLIAATTNPYVLTGLTAETRYVVKVRANCGDAQSEWANDSVVFTTAVACPAPLFSADSIKNILTTSAELVWGGSSESYTVSYRTAAYIDGIDEGFEDATEFAQWQAYGVVSTNTGSRFGRLTTAAHTGDYGFAFSSYSNATDYNQYLISPEINVSGELKFFYKASSSSGTETFKVGYSSTGNAESDFTWGDEISTNSTSWQQHSETVPAGTKYIAFHYYSNYQYNLWIDDISLGTPIPAGAWVVESGITANSKQLTGLTTETKYEVKIQGNCGDEGLSLETDSILFSTVSSCQVPSDLEASAITLNSANISWNGYEQTGFNLRYTSDGENWTVLTNVTSPCTLSNLSPSTYYGVQVQVACDTESWSQLYEFQTLNGVPFADAGANGVMNEWETYGKLASDVFAGQAMSGYGNWALANDNEVFEGQHFKLNIYGSSRKDWLVSPSIDATGVQLAAGEKLKLGFKMALAKWSSSGSVATLPDTTGTDDKFIVAFSIDNGVTWLQANATEWNNSGAPTIFNSIPNTGVDILLDLSAAAGHMLKFAFYGESTVQNADNDLHIGNITLEVIGNTTDIRNLDATDKAVKFLENGQIYIRLNGTTYDVTGRKIK